MIEEKLIKKNDLEQAGTLEHFGWSKSESNAKNKMLYIRDTDMPYYKELKIVEEKYEQLKKELIPQYKVIAPLFVFLTLMFIVPGLLYRNIVNKHNYEIEENNNLVYEKMEEILDKASRYTNI